MRRFDGKLALITGGNSGIGLATAKALASEGARVAVTGRDEGSLREAAKAIGNDCLAVQCDTADIKSMDPLFSILKQRFGALDILFANAGTGGLATLDKATEQDFDRIFGINVKGLFFTVQKALPLLRNGASVILNASISPRMGRTGASLYSGSKAAVRAFARNFSAELAPREIRVNVVSPGSIDTPMWDRAFRDPRVAAEAKQRAARAVPLGRMGRPEEVAQAVLFLASDQSSFVTGTEIIVDGGRRELPDARVQR
jgi:NAD(P)-dependent dehydrogenase (short-subunit alcohol dehydrogenase family)